MYTSERLGILHRDSQTWLAALRWEYAAGPVLAAKTATGALAAASVLVLFVQDCDLDDCAFTRQRWQRSLPTCSPERRYGAAECPRLRTLVLDLSDLELPHIGRRLLTALAPLLWRRPELELQLWGVPWQMLAWAAATSGHRAVLRRASRICVVAPPSLCYLSPERQLRAVAQLRRRLRPSLVTIDYRAQARLPPPPGRSVRRRRQWRLSGGGGGGGDGKKSEVK